MFVLESYATALGNEPMPEGGRLWAKTLRLEGYRAYFEGDTFVVDFLKNEAGETDEDMEFIRKDFLNNVVVIDFLTYLRSKKIPWHWEDIGTGRGECPYKFVARFGQSPLWKMGHKSLAKVRRNDG